MSIVVCDDFFPNPDDIRRIALTQEYEKFGSAGLRSKAIFANDYLKYRFGQLLNIKITSWATQPANGRFQFCTSEDPIVYHSDEQKWAGVAFLTPNAPVIAGLSLWQSRILPGARRCPENPALARIMYAGNLDRTVWEEVDRIGNVYNRLVLWDGQLVHSPSCYFGTDINNARLFQVFFFE